MRMEKKKRVGNPNGDGGYVIIDGLGDYDLLLSAGIADDISFEDEFLKDKNIKCFAFDGTIQRFSSIYDRKNTSNPEIILKGYPYNQSQSQ